MKPDTKISCDVCQDLIPLVLDHVASDDSTLLVTTHVASCASCRELLGEEPIMEQHLVTNDQNIIKNMKKSIYISMLGLLIFGGLFGLALSNSSNMFYNFIIMPTVGALSYVIFRKRWYLPCFILGGISYIWIIIFCSITDGYDSSLYLFSLYVTGVYVFFELLGVLIAKLLHYAFRKGE